MNTTKAHLDALRTLPSEPASLCAAAGSAAVRIRGRRADRKRQGSFLVLVVGTLALIAIITIVFVALGSQDSRTRSAVEARTRLDAVPPQIADHIAGIIAQDAVATRTDIVSSVASLNFAQQLVRETTDAPGVRYDVQTFTNDPNTRFNPVGTAPNQWDPSLPGAIAPSDPWLAANAAVDFNNTTTGLQKRDWAFISNIAPDGAFVNLSALRNQRPFDVSSADLRVGVTTTNDWVAPADLNRPAAFTNRQLGAHVPAAVASGVDWNDPQMKLNQWADADGDGWLDSRWFEMRREYAAGQFADEIDLADRRTRYFFAARIIDLSGLINIHTATDLMGGPTTDYPLGLTPADVDLRRVLMGVDAIKDSSGSDIVAALSPSAATQWPIGAGDSVDFDAPNSLFIGSQAYLALKLSTHTGTPLPRVFGPDVVADDETTAIDVNGPIWLRGANKFEDVFGLAPQIDSPYSAINGPGVEWLTGFPFAPSAGLGATPWTAAEIQRAGRTRLGSYVRIARTPQGTDAALGGNPNVFGQRATLPFGVQDLGELLERHGVNSDRSSALERVLSGRVLGFESLDPLRSNRPQDFELRVADLSSAALADGLTALPEADILKAIDTRSLLTTISGARHLRPVVSRIDPANPLAQPQRFSWQLPTDVEQLADPELINEAKLDIIAALSNTLYAGNPDPVIADPVRVQFASAPVETILPPARDPQLWRIFDGYAMALAPYAFLNDSAAGLNAWEYQLGGQGGFSLAGTPGFIGTANAQSLQTLFYGYRGPHVAMQVAAHMATNLADITDPDSEPTVTTIEFNRNYVQNTLAPSIGLGSNTVDGIAATSNTELDDLLPGYYAMEQNSDTVFNDARTAPTAVAGVDRVVANQRLTVEDDPRLPVDPNNTVAPVMNVYGIEPQPFITQVAAVTVYQDNDGDLALTGQTPSDAASGEVRIRADIDALNQELLYRAVIVQLSNPFDRPIRLSSAPFEETRRQTGAGTSVAEPILSSAASGSAVLGDPGAYVSMYDLVGSGYTASRLNSFYYVDIGDANAATLAERGKRFVLASLVEQTYVAADDPDVVDAADPANIGNFIRTGTNGVIPAAAPTAIPTLQPIVIPPGETVTCIGLSRAPSEIFRRLNAKDPGINTAAPINLNDRERILRVLTRQFAAELDTNGRTKLENIHWMPQIDVETGEFLGFGTAGSATPGNPEFVDVVPSLTAGTLQDDAPQYVSLWRTVRGPQERQHDLAWAWNTTMPATFFNGDPFNVENPNISELYLIRRNNFENDQLVDRFMVRTRNSPAVTDRATLDLRLKTIPAVINSDYDITNATETPTGAPGEVLVSSDELTLMLAAWVRRPSDNEQSLATGMLPAWAIEPKYYARDLSWNVAYRTSKTQDVQLAAPGTAIPVSDFATSTTGPFNGLTQNVGTWREEMDGTDIALPDSVEMNIIDPSDLINPPQLFGLDWVGENAGATTDPHPFGTAAFEGAVAKFTVPSVVIDNTLDFRVSSLVAPANTPAAGTDTLEFSDNRLQFFHAENTPTLNSSQNYRKTLNVLRLTDLLLPAGVGPFSVPFDRATGVPNLQDYSTGEPQLTQFLTRHTTLGEIIAEVQGYSIAVVSEGPAPDGFAAGGLDPAVWFSSATRSQGFAGVDSDNTTRIDETLFDGVNLALDRFVPFVDTNGDRFRDPADEPTAFSELPVALNVLDQFVIAPPAMPAPLIDPATTPFDPVLPARPLASSSTVAQPGLVNINTASERVLRALPGVAPQFANGVTGAAPTPEYDWATQLFGAQFGTDIDLAAMMESYRTFGVGNIRQTSFTNPALTGAYSTGTGSPDTSLSIGGTPADLLAGGFPIPAGRTPQRTTGVAGNEDLATTATDERSLFRGVGEVLNAHFGGPTIADVPSLKQVPVGADALAYNRDPATGNELDTSLQGLSRFRAKLTQGDGNTATGVVPRGYDEKLALTSSFINTITTRSDYFAAWFVVHGYREEDTTNLTSNTQPMIPSVARRFLMVIDRSQVTQLGQKPKVLLMQEVPYEFPAKK